MVGAGCAKAADPATINASPASAKVRRVIVCIVRSSVVIRFWLLPVRFKDCSALP
jgi:hypothetical protein